MKDRTFNLYLGYSWSFGTSRQTLTQFLKSERGFWWREYSLSADDPVHGVSREELLLEAVAAKMEKVDCVLILGGVCDTFRRWTHAEIKCAKARLAKPIVVVEPWATEKTSPTLKKYADRVVKWKRSEIVRAIRTLVPDPDEK